MPLPLPHFNALTRNWKPLYENNITDTEIMFEYFDNKEFEEVSNTIFKTVNYHGIFYTVINIKPYIRLKKLSKLTSKKHNILDEIAYYIEYCESKKVKFSLLNHINQM